MLFSFVTAVSTRLCFYLGMDAGFTCQHFRSSQTCNKLKRVNNIVNLHRFLHYSFNPSTALCSSKLSAKNHAAQNEEWLLRAISTPTPPFPSNPKCQSSYEEQIQFICSSLWQQKARGKKYTKELPSLAPKKISPLPQCESTNYTLVLFKDISRHI